MDNLAQMTLELFMNKNAYNRYIEKTDPNKFEEHREYIQKTKKYKDRILGITRRFLEDSTLQITGEMNDMFYDYCKTCIKYFELKDLEETCTYEREHDTDEIMFDPLDMNEYDTVADVSIKGHHDIVHTADTKYSKKQDELYTLDAFMRKI
jgi:hypothetical protein